MKPPDMTSLQDGERTALEALARQIQCPVESLLFLIDSRHEAGTLSALITIPEIQTPLL